MKRAVILFIVLCLTLSWTGCGEAQEEKTLFYYLRSEETIRYGEADALIAPVEQDISSPNADLDYLLQRYLDGPVDENYRNPFPKGTYLLSTILREDMLVVVLSREFSTLYGIRLTLAGACLSATCHNLTGLDRIQVRSGESIYDFDFNDHIFLDDSAGK